MTIYNPRFYYVSVGLLIFINNFIYVYRNETSTVSLRMLDDNGRKVFNAAFGLHYTLRAEISKSDGNLCIL